MLFENKSVFILSRNQINLCITCTGRPTHTDHFCDVCLSICLSLCLSHFNVLASINRQHMFFRTTLVCSLWRLLSDSTFNSMFITLLKHLNNITAFSWLKTDTSNERKYYLSVSQQFLTWKSLCISLAIVNQRFSLWHTWILQFPSKEAMSGTFISILFISSWLALIRKLSHKFEINHIAFRTRSL